MKKKILGIMLIIAIILLVIIPIAYASEPVTLDIGGQELYITDTGFKFNTSLMEIAYTGTYNIYGNATGIYFINNSSNEVTFDIISIGLDTYPIYIEGNSDIILNIKIMANTILRGITNYNTGNTTVNVSIENGALYISKTAER